jgi:phage gpG-like protein
MQLVKDLSSRANIGKLRQIIGSERANRLLQELDRSAAALELRAAIATNSKTAIRQSVQGQIADEAAPGILRRTAGNVGNPLDAAQDITRTLTSIDPRSMSAREKAIFDEIAQALVGIKGAEAQAALKAVRRAMNGQPIKDAEAALIGKVAGGSIGLGSYQTGVRWLETQ